MHSLARIRARFSAVARMRSAGERLLRLPGALELLVAVAAGLLYAPTLGFGFVFDDHALIGPDGPRFVGGAWLPYRPLRHASFLIDHRLGGGAPWAYHLGNVILHATAAGLLVRLARRAGVGATIAGLCAFGFAAHPLAVESVAYISGRRDVLAGLLVIAALLAWTSLRGLSALAVLFAVLAVAVKESALLCVPTLLLASLCRLGPPARRALAPLVFAGIAAVALPISYGARGPVASSASPAQSVRIAGVLAEHYARHLVAPARLSVEYPFLRCNEAGCLDASWRPHAVTGLLLLSCLVAASAFGLARARRGRPVGEAWGTFSLLWIATTMLALSFVIGAHEPGVDRHAYPLLAAVALAAAVYLSGVARPLRVGATALLALWVTVFAVRADARMEVWRNDLALWSDAAVHASSSARVQHNLASALAARGRYGQARRRLARALDADKGYWPALLGYAAINCERGRSVAAAARLHEATLIGADAGQVAVVRERCAELARR